MLNIRPATPDDVPLILQFIRDLAEYEREPQAAVATAADLLRDGWGPQPKFRCVIADWNGQPAAFTFVFGRMAGDLRQGWTLLAAMLLLFSIAVGVVSLSRKWFETDSNKDVREIDILEDNRRRLLRLMDTLPEECRQCQHLRLCWGDCPRTRLLRTRPGEGNLSYLCSGWQRFFDHASAALISVAWNNLPK